MQKRNRTVDYHGQALGWLSFRIPVPVPVPARETKGFRIFCRGGMDGLRARGCWDSFAVEFTCCGVLTPSIVSIWLAGFSQSSAVTFFFYQCAYIQDYRPAVDDFCERSAFSELASARFVKVERREDLKAISQDIMIS